MKRIISNSEKKKVLHLANNGFSRANIVKMSGVSKGSIDKILRDNKVSSFGRNKSIRLNHDNIVKELHSKGIPDKEAYKQSGISYAQYLFVRKKLGLKYIAIKQEYKYSDRQKEILLGTMMGDGNISKSGKGIRIETYKINIGHSHKQYKYFEWKVNELDLQGEIYCRKTMKGYWGLWSSSLPYENLKYYYHMFYKDGKKVITKNMLDKLTPLSIAVWYMDDGTVSDTYYICTQSFGKEGCEKIKNWLYNKYNIESTLNYPKDENQPVIRIKSSSRNEFTKIIESYILPEMRYKIYSSSPSKKSR